MKIMGPYIHNTGRLKGRRYIALVTDNGKRTTMLYSRHLMEEKIGRSLTYDECVDHINEDATDDRIENLQILTRKENFDKSFRIKGVRAESYEFDCPICGIHTTKAATVVRHNRKQGKAGPFCGKVCSRKWQVKNSFRPLV